MTKEKSFRPDASFYESDLKTIAIRACCAEIIIILRSLIKPQGEEANQLVLLAKLEQLEAELIDYGIHKDIHVGKPTEFFATNPRRSAEFCAGQLMHFVDREVITEGNIAVLAEEHNLIDHEDSDDQTYVINPRNVPDRLIQFCTLIGTIRTIEEMLDLSSD